MQPTGATQPRTGAQAVAMRGTPAVPLRPEAFQGLPPSGAGERLGTAPRAGLGAAVAATAGVVLSLLRYVSG